MKKIISEVSSKKEQYGSIVATVHDKYGNLKQKVEQPVDSFNRQMWRNFFNWAVGNQNGFQAGTKIVSLSNTEPSAFGFSGGRCDAQPNSYAGIVIGSGTTQTNYNTVLMESIIDFSPLASSGTLAAQETTIEYYNDQRKAIVTRSFLNITSGSSVTINEVGIAVSGQVGEITKANSYLFVRDVLLNSVTVDFEDVLSVQYQLTISSGTYNYSNIFIRSQFGTNRSNTAIQLTNTTGTLLNVASSWNDKIIANAEESSGLTTNTGNINQSLVFGTGNTAFSLTQLDLANGITHGNGAGQLFYHPSNYTNIVENSVTNSMSFKIIRAVENRSGSDITISEIGLFKSHISSRLLLDRKVLSNAVTITNGNIVTFQWEFCYEV